MEREELKNLVLIGLLTLAVLYVGYLGLGGLWPGISTLQSQSNTLRAKRNSLQQSVQSAEQQVRRLAEIRREREQLNQQLQELAKRLPAQRETPQVLEQLERVAGGSGLTLTAINRPGGRSQELFVEIPLELGVAGSYHDLLRFADQLTKLERLVTLHEFVIWHPVPRTGGVEFAGLKHPLTDALSFQVPHPGKREYTYLSLPPVPDKQTLPASVPPGTLIGQVVALVYQVLPEPAAAPGAPPRP